MRVNVLGTEYSIISSTSEENNKLKNCDGYCDNSVKEIVIDSFEPCEMSKKDLRFQKNKVIRHELIHAFLFESGLAENSEWAMNEEMVDFFAMQFPKMKRTFEDCGVL